MEEVIDMRQLIESISKTKWYLNPGPPWLELIVLSSLQHQVTTQVHGILDEYFSFMPL